MIKPSESLKPLEDLKFHTSEAVDKIVNSHQSLILTENGIAKIIVQNIKDYEQMQETLNILKILALSNKNLREGKVRNIDESFKFIRNKSMILMNC